LIFFYKGIKREREDDSGAPDAKKIKLEQPEPEATKADPAGSLLSLPFSL